MGYADEVPPSIRADAFPATLYVPNHFQILILTFVTWDVIKFTWSIQGGPKGGFEAEAGKEGAEFSFPAQSGLTYSFTAQGCAKALDGSTNYCSPISRPLEVVAAQNTPSLKHFLQRSGIDPSKGIRSHLPLGPTSLRSLLGL
jgi:hypothetical protein